MLGHVRAIKNISDHSGWLHTCEAEIEALVLECQLVMIHAATFENRGVEITDVDFLVRRGDVE